MWNTNNPQRNQYSQALSAFYNALNETKPANQSAVNGAFNTMNSSVFQNALQPIPIPIPIPTEKTIEPPKINHNNNLLCTQSGNDGNKF